MVRLNDYNYVDSEVYYYIPATLIEKQSPRGKMARIKMIEIHYIKLKIIKRLPHIHTFMCLTLFIKKQSQSSLSLVTS